LVLVDYAVIGYFFNLGVWINSSTILWVLLALSNYKLIRASIDGERSKVIVLGIVVAVFTSLAAYSVADLVEKRRVLLDSTDPQTEPQRLRDL
jgi:hypothetical protein